MAAVTNPTGKAALQVMTKHHALNDVPYVRLLIEGDFVGQTEVAVALPMVEKYLTKAVVPGRVVETPEREGLILKGRYVYDGEVFQDIA